MTKALLILNTLLSVTIIVFATLQFTGTYDFIGIEESVALPEEFLEEYEEVKNYVFDQIETEEFVRDSAELENTLSTTVSGVGISGFVDLRGYLVTEPKEVYGATKQLAYFAFTEASDDTIMSALDKLVDEGNTINRVSGGVYYLGLGCQENDGIENEIFNISRDTFSKLQSSSSTTKIKVRAFFGSSSSKVGGGPCMSHASGLQVL